MRGSVAVIGAGVSGITAAYLLQRKYDVTLYEADDRLGGHAHTHDLTDSQGSTVAVDSGFIVHNRRTYPYLLKLFQELDVPTQATEMSMSIKCSGCGLEYAGGRGLKGILADPASLARPRFLALLAQVPRFHRHARALLESTSDGPNSGEITLGQFLAEGGYSAYFVDHFIVPLVSAVWSCAIEEVRHYPARYLFAFLANHGMLTVKGSPTWRTVVGGSRVYVERATKELTAIRSNTPVATVRRAGRGVVVEAENEQRFDAVVVATHPDQALRLLAQPTAAEREVLGAFRYSVNETALHQDESVLPRHRNARSSWNYRLADCGSGPTVSYDMNILQRLSTRDSYVVTLNGNPSRVIARMSYAHPIYTPEALAAQHRLPELNDGVLAYAGAYHGWGFHEDGCRSGVRAAESLGVSW